MTIVKTEISDFTVSEDRTSVQFVCPLSNNTETVEISPDLNRVEFKLPSCLTSEHDEKLGATLHIGVITFSEEPNDEDPQDTEITETD